MFAGNGYGWREMMGETICHSLITHGLSQALKCGDWMLIRNTDAKASPANNVVPDDVSSPDVVVN